jgi:peptide/nickel transport system substrate-binding protein
MKRLRWQILVVLATLVVVSVLLLSQQPVLTPILPEAAPGGVYTEAVVGSLGRLNPLLDWNNPADRDANRLLFSGLVRFDSRGLPQPDLAESWGVSADGTIYNFTLRPNAVWHDGVPVTSEDVTFTVDLIRSSSLFPADIKNLWEQIDVRQLDENNLKFTLPEPFAPFLDYATFGVLPKHILGTTAPAELDSAAFNISPIGTGPYRFERLIVEGGQIAGVVLTVNDRYYGAMPYIQQVVLRYFPDSNSAFDAYEQGEVLGVSEISHDVLPDALADPELAMYTSHVPQITMVMLNIKSQDAPFLDNANVRRALLLGLNRNFIIASLLQGEAIVANGPILPGSWAHYDAIERLTDRRAVQLLKEEVTSSRQAADHPGQENLAPDL